MAPRKHCQSRASSASSNYRQLELSQPFGIGDQTSIVVPASGLLYLGINDDNVSDNSGQFQVVISW